MNDRKEPHAGQFYRHFKNKTYQIITVAVHSETKEKLVIYQALYADFKIYARPLEMFMSEVDTKKYPEARQKYRFELIEQEPEEINAEDSKEAADGEKEAPVIQASGGKLSDFPEISENDWIEEETVNPLLLEFLDAESYEEKLNLIVGMKRKLTDRLITEIAISMDVTIDPGSFEERYEELKTCIETKERFECNRLR